MGHQVGAVRHRTGCCQSWKVQLVWTPRPEPNAHHLALTLGKPPASHRGAETRGGPSPLVPQFRSPRVTSENPEKRGAGKLLRLQGKMARASSGRKRKGYSQEWPGVLCPTPKLPQGKVSNEAAAGEQQPARPPLPKTTWAWQGRAGNFTTSSFSDFGFAATPGQWQPPHNRGREGETHSPSSLHGASARPAGNCSFISATPLNSKATPLPASPEAGGGRRGSDPGAGVGRLQSRWAAGVGAEFQAHSPSRVAPPPWLRGPRWERALRSRFAPGRAGRPGPAPLTAWGEPLAVVAARVMRGGRAGRGRARGRSRSEGERLSPRAHREARG